MWRSEFYGKGDFSYADFLYTFGVIDEVASLGDLVGGREIYTISLEVAKINMSKMFMTISFNIWIHKSTVLMFRTNRHCIFFISLQYHGLSHWQQNLSYHSLAR